MPARTVAALRLLASRWLRSCWITRWECCGWGEEDVLGPKPQPPHGLRARAALAGPPKSRWSSKAGTDKSEIPKASGHRRRRDTPVPPPSSSPLGPTRSKAQPHGRPGFPYFSCALLLQNGSRINFKVLFSFPFSPGPRSYW